MFPIELTRDEDNVAVDEAILRMANVVRQKMSDAYMKPNLSREQQLRYAIQGARGELAVARWLQLPWTGAGIDGRDRKDVGDRIEVRTSARATGLIVKVLEQKKNQPSTPYVLVHNLTGPKLAIIGWITLGDALEVGEEYEQRGVWFRRVPKQHLRPMSELSCLIRS